MNKKSIIIFCIAMASIFLILIIIKSIEKSNTERKYKNEDSIVSISRNISKKLNIEFKNKRNTYDDVEYTYIDEVEVYNDDVYTDLDDEYGLDNKYTDDCYHLAIRVLKFNSNYEAKVYYKYMQIRWNFMRNNFANTFYSKSGHYKYYTQHENDLCIIKGIYLVYLNEKYQTKENIKMIESIIEKYPMEDIKKREEKEVDEYWKKEQIESEERIKQMAEEYIEKVKKKKMSIEEDEQEQPITNNNSTTKKEDPMDALRKCIVMEAADIYTTGGNSSNAFNDAKKQCESWYKQWGEKDFIEAVTEDWNNRQNEQLNGKPLAEYLNTLGW